MYTVVFRRTRFVWWDGRTVDLMIERSSKSLLSSSTSCSGGREKSSTTATHNVLRRRSPHRRRKRKVHDGVEQIYASPKIQLRAGPPLVGRTTSTTNVLALLSLISSSFSLSPACSSRWLTGLVSLNLPSRFFCPNKTAADGEWMDIICGQQTTTHA